MNYLVEIPIIRKKNKRNDTKAAKFKGTLKFISNKYGIIYDWNIQLDFVEIDIFTTKSWFAKPNQLFKTRERLFEKLGLTQKERPKWEGPGKKPKDFKINDLVKLDNNQLIILNEFLNSREKDGYRSTIKNIVGILKGNNPGGEAKNPKSAEMIINNEDMQDTSLKNFVILFDDLVRKKNKQFEHYERFAQEKSFNDFTKLNRSLAKAFDYMQKTKEPVDFEIYLDDIKKYYEEYAGFTQKARKITRRAISQYSKNIQSNVKKFPFGFNSKDQFQQCHIYECKTLLDKIEIALKEERDYSKYVEQIKDYNNFIPLPEEVHRQFDKYRFSYLSNGKIWPLSEKGKEIVETIVNPKFYQIPEYFLNDKRKRYIMKRNADLNID